MHIHVQRQMRAQTSVLWKYLSDFSNVYQFHPLFKNSSFSSGSCIEGKGAERECVMVDGSFMKERVIQWEEGKFYTVELIDSSLPLKAAVATLGVSPVNKKISAAYLHIEIHVKYKLLKPFFYSAFKYIVGPSILRGLDQISLNERRAIAAYCGFTL
ncbi:MAG: SRPBCC family protein [Bacteroidota bacterium]